MTYQFTVKNGNVTEARLKWDDGTIEQLHSSPIGIVSPTGWIPPFTKPLRKDDDDLYLRITPPSSPVMTVKQAVKPTHFHLRNKLPYLKLNTPNYDTLFVDHEIRPNPSFMKRAPLSVYERDDPYKY